MSDRRFRSNGTVFQGNPLYTSRKARIELEPVEIRSIKKQINELKRSIETAKDIAERFGLTLSQDTLSKIAKLAKLEEELKEILKDA